MALNKNEVQFKGSILEYRAGKFSDEKSGREIVYKKVSVFMLGREYTVNSELDCTGRKSEVDYLLTFVVKPHPKEHYPIFILVDVTDVKQ